MRPWRDVWDYARSRGMSYSDLRDSKSRAWRLYAGEIERTCRLEDRLFAQAAELRAMSLRLQEAQTELDLHRQVLGVPKIVR